MQSSHSGSNLTQRQVRRRRTSLEDLAKPNSLFPQCQSHPSVHRPDVRANFKSCEDRTLVSPRVREELRKRKKSLWCLDLWSAPSLIIQESYVGVVGSKAGARARYFFPGCSTGVCLRRTCRGFRPSQQRTLQKIVWDQGKRVAVHRPIRIVAFFKHKHVIAVGSQQRMRSRHQPRRGPQDCKKSCATHAGSQSSNGTIAARAGKLMRAEMINSMTPSNMNRCLSTLSMASSNSPRNVCTSIRLGSTWEWHQCIGEPSRPYCSKPLSGYRSLFLWQPHHPLNMSTTVQFLEARFLSL